jgi:hypothetical protein
MATTQNQNFTCTTDNQQGSVVNSTCAPQFRVTYRFRFVRKVSMPYAVAVNGQALPEFQARPKRTDDRISLLVTQGQTVSLFLNSDAHPDYRHEPVYRVGPISHDTEITINEIGGHHTTPDTPTPAGEHTDPHTGKVTKKWTAPLTGDVWMKISHKYTPSEAEGLIPTGTSETIRNAVLRVYSGLTSPHLSVAFPAEPDRPALNLVVNFEDSTNPHQNITNYTLLRDGLARVHPAGYAALLVAARDSGVSPLKITSCWRPMLGSIAHRAGLGLDVNYIGQIRLNREELRQPNAIHAGNVSDEEKALFTERENARRDLRTLEAQHAPPAQIAIARLRVTTTQNEWQNSLASHTPQAVLSFRRSVMQCSCVKQLFDPWYMDVNTRDAQQPQPNAQSTPNEKLHAHHLHVTINEPKIL